LDHCAMPCGGLQIGQAGTRASARADVATEVHVRVAVAGTVLVAIGAGKTLGTADFAAELDEKVGRRDPFHLPPVVLVLAAEESLVDERRVVEIPCVLVDVVEIADAGEEAPELGRKAPGRR